MHSRSPLFFLLLLLFAGTGCAPSEEAQEAESPVRAVPEVMSDAGEAWFSGNADGTLIVFGRHGEGWSGHTLYGMQRSEEGWSEAAILPFSGTWNDRGARFYPVLDVLIFSSDRPLPGETEAGDFNLWLATHDGEKWLDPEPFVVTVSDANDFHASVSSEGTIHFASDREGGQGRSDLYRAVLGSMGYAVEPVPGPVNTAYSESDVWVDPNGRYLIFSRTDDPDGMGGDDLWISFREGESWGEPVNLGEEVNSTEYEYGAWVTRDGKTLYFTTHRNGNADIMSVPLGELGIEGPAGWLDPVLN